MKNKATEKKSFQSLAKELDEIKLRIPIGSKRYHYKNKNNHYEVQAIVIDQKSQSPMVIYLCLYDDSKSDVSFARLASVFLEDVEREGELTQRFTKID